MNILVVFGLLLIQACSFRPGLWKWEHPNPVYEEECLARDISECERFAQMENMDGNFKEFHSARDYGGWGNFSFEFCMQQRGWRLEYEKK